MCAKPLKTNKNRRRNRSSTFPASLAAALRNARTHVSSTVEHHGAFQGKDTARTFSPRAPRRDTHRRRGRGTAGGTCRSRDGPVSESFFLLGFKSERTQGASALRRRGDDDACDCPLDPLEATRDNAGAFRRPDGFHRAVPGHLRLRHFSRVPVTSFVLIPVRSLTRIPRLTPTVPPIPHRRPPRADRGPAGAPNLPHEALVPRRHPREVEVLVRARQTSFSATNATREERHTGVERTRSTSDVGTAAEVYGGVYARPSARGGRARRSYPRGHLPTPRESKTSSRVLRVLGRFLRGARGGARAPASPSVPERSDVARTRCERLRKHVTDVLETHPPSRYHTFPSAGTSCLA